MLHHHEHILVGLEGLLEHDYILVLEFLHEHELATDGGAPVLVYELALVVDFDSVILAVVLASSQFHHSISSLAQLPSKLKVFLDFVWGAVRAQRGRTGVFHFVAGRLH